MDFIELIKYAIQELSTSLGVSPIIPSAILIISMAGVVGSLTSRLVGTHFGMILGLGPLLFGVWVGLIPLWIAMIGGLLGLLVTFSSLFGGERSTSSVPEEEVQIDPNQARKPDQEIPGPPVLESKPKYKPPWSK